MFADLPRAAGLACGVSLAFACAATAQDDFVMYLDTPEACAVTQDMDYEERPFRAIHDGGAMLISPWGMEAVEYSCEFESDIVFDWSESTTQIRAGYCTEPGPFLYPQIFVIGMDMSQPDVVQVWSSTDPSGEATEFTACRQM